MTRASSGTTAVQDTRFNIARHSHRSHPRRLPSTATACRDRCSARIPVCRGAASVACSHAAKRDGLSRRRGIRRIHHRSAAGGRRHGPGVSGAASAAAPPRRPENPAHASSPRTTNFANASTARPTWPPACTTSTSSASTTAANTRATVDLDGLRGGNRRCGTAAHPVPVRDAASTTSSRSFRPSPTRSTTPIHADCCTATSNPPTSCWAMPHPRRRILLADFGIARELGEISGLTATNMAMGTTAYCAPEQLQGFDLDGRADQYALGLHRVPPADRRRPVPPLQPGGGHHPASVRATAAHQRAPTGIGRPRRASSPRPSPRTRRPLCDVRGFRGRTRRSARQRRCHAAGPTQYITAPTQVIATPRSAPPQRAKAARAGRLIAALVAVALVAVAAIRRCRRMLSGPSATGQQSAAPRRRQRHRPASPAPPASATPAIKLTSQVTDAIGCARARSSPTR